MSEASAAVETGARTVVRDLVQLLLTFERGLDADALERAAGTCSAPRALSGLGDQLCAARTGCLAVDQGRRVLELSL